LSELMTSVPDRKPNAVGVKVTLMVQLAPIATAGGQLFVWAKSPVVVMLLMLSVDVPVFVRRTVWAVVVEPTAS